MAGIYLHIPFCKTRCIYCDFYSTTRSEQKARYIRALCQELEERKDYLQGQPVKTIYFGGGTPSQLSQADLEVVFHTLERVYGISSALEITLEANPDDLTEAYVALLRTLPINRISMGVQTFDDLLLQRLGRRHNAAQVLAAVERCRRAGFNNLSMDLIYGLPGETDHRWQQDLQQAIALHAEHLSAYHLTYEEGTPLHTLLQQHRITEVDEETSLRFFYTLTDTLTAAGYEHYEISNFCQPGKHSRHNTSYWQGIPYLGCGPSAHSFNGTSREWNTASLDAYLSSMEQGKRAHETELLSTASRYNEYILTGLRILRGISTTELGIRFGTPLQQYCLEQAKPHLASGKLERNGDRLRLTREGIFLSDGLISDLLYVKG